MITLRNVDGKLVTQYNDMVVDDHGDLIKELNSRLNEGYKVLSIDNGVYTLDIDTDQLCFISYIDSEYGYCYYKVTDHVTAGMIRSYYDGCLTRVDTRLNDEGFISEYEFKSEYCEIIDLRKKSEGEIAIYRDKESKTNTNFLEAIETDISNAW